MERVHDLEAQLKVSKNELDLFKQKVTEKEANVSQLESKLTEKKDKLQTLYTDLAEKTTELEKAKFKIEYYEKQLDDVSQ